MSTNEIPEVKAEENTVYYYKWYIDFYNSNDPNAGDRTKRTNINPVYLSSFTMIKKYKTENIPQIHAKMKFRVSDIITLGEWQKNCLVDITCKILVFSKTENDAMTQTDSKIIFSTKVIPIFNSSTFKSKYKKEQAESLDRATEGLDTGEKMVNMILLNSTAQNALKEVYNKVIEDGTVGTAIQWMTCSLLPTSGGAIIDTPDNNGNMGDIVIPPLSYIQAMNFIQANYGIYENGMMIFYDIDGILYVLDKYAYEHDCVEGATTLTKIFKTESRDETVGNIVRKTDDNKNPQYIGAMQIKRVDNEVLDGELTGKTIVFSSFGQAMDSILYDNESDEVSLASKVSAALTRNVPTNNVSGDKIITEYDELNNIYNMSSYFNEIECNTQRVNILLNNVNIKDFAPNVIIELGFEDIERNNKQSGQYFLNEVVFKFNRLKEADNLGLGASDKEDEEYKYPPSVTTCSSALGISRANPEK